MTAASELLAGLTYLNDFVTELWGKILPSFAPLLAPVFLSFFFFLSDRGRILKQGGLCIPLQHGSNFLPLWC